MYTKLYMLSDIVKNICPSKKNEKELIEFLYKKDFCFMKQLIQTYCKIFGGDHSQNIMTQFHDNVLLLLHVYCSSLYTPMLCSCFSIQHTLKGSYKQQHNLDCSYNNKVKRDDRMAAVGLDIYAEVLFIQKTVI